MGTRTERAVEARGWHLTVQWQQLIKRNQTTHAGTVGALITGLLLGGCGCALGVTQSRKEVIMLAKVIELLKSMGWQDAGFTPVKSYRTTTIAFSGPIVTLGGRVRLRKERWTVTVGERTTVFSLKPDNPERVGRSGVYTYRDWEQYRYNTKDLTGIEKKALEIKGRLNNTNEIVA